MLSKKTKQKKKTEVVLSLEIWLKIHTWKFVPRRIIAHTVSIWFGNFCFNTAHLFFLIFQNFVIMRAKSVCFYTASDLRVTKGWVF